MEVQKKEIKERLQHIKNKILVMSGKGGVGKSSVAAYLSVALSKKGFTVGLMDVDLHGPSIPRILGLKGTVGPGHQKGKAHPVTYLPNMEVISIEVLMGDKDAATIWRGPLKGGVIRQFISDIEWMDLDYMIIDSPPGTGDEPLTVAQTISDAKALIVTTPQEVSLADVRKSINFCRQVKMEILGLVENMSGLKCPYCGKMIDVFKTQGGMLTAKKENLRLLGTLPMEPEIVKKGDAGDLSLLDNQELLITQEFNKIVDEIVKITKTPTDSVPESQKKNELPGIKKDSADTKVQDGKIKETKMRIPPTHEPGVLPRWLNEQGADVAIVGGMGERAQQLLRENGIEVITGAPMDSPESLANQYLSNTLVLGENLCDH
ncbi:MAG: chromosome partitioning protein ParA [Desulfobacteraceae bacterium 4484_190.3]|nr:MAG: chromosome partitioning protein ParA [Desulfobacteraceae bacterium 4484_190.3]